ncbi:lipopolysaccharide biosynthesis protein [Fulvivirga sediminis]|uniref:Polysaccharide biosynthesis C-terminal domain-containing protein n=1 Tax=Fulvivirga sediminis TaxID=2803949 RepID=A0A937K021_9BACT|nr:polysaccharide biosynthesis C-terminal domain-containing protein [Fulvivirga sediminis]MBL3655032.1 polysaccharide biosynthesis C-terminal domain-containing protein [Fulvivirga sediminis]
MSKIKSLASQTAIYGISSILGRLLNYALVPIHTDLFPNPDDLGVVTGLYAYTAIFLVLYTFGMETAFFRFATKDNKEETYNATASFVVLCSTALSILIIIFSDSLATWAGYPTASNLVTWLAIILWIDGLLAIPFARIRLENKAKLFASARIINIIINVGLQILFLYLIPLIISKGWEGSGWLESVYKPDLGIGYIFLANLIANILLLAILGKWLLKVKLTFNKKKLKPILIYASPILLTGLAGMLNEQLDKILIEKFLPVNFYDGITSTAAVGIYGQTFKLSIFMMLAIQAFRYAGEPFFFSNAKDKKAPELFAKIMHYFVLLSLLIFLMVSINVELIGFVFLRSSAYRSALYLVPILLLGKLFYGIYMNLSIWFKLTDQTMYGTYFSLFGAAITIVGNILLIPIIGYTGSAITSVLCYLCMTIICYKIGNKKYPIPYNFKILSVYIIISCIIASGTQLFKLENFWLDSIVKLAISLSIVVFIYLVEKPKLVRN